MNQESLATHEAPAATTASTKNTSTAASDTRERQDCPAIDFTEKSSDAEPSTIGNSGSSEMDRVSIDLQTLTVHSAKELGEAAEPSPDSVVTSGTSPAAGVNPGSINEKDLESSATSNLSCRSRPGQQQDVKPSIEVGGTDFASLGARESTLDSPRAPRQAEPVLPTSLDGLPSCCCPGCDNQGKFLCARCKSARYCSTSCQQSDWAEHKSECKGLVQRPYIWDYERDRHSTRVPWLAAEFAVGPEQSTELPEEHDHFKPWWDEIEEVVDGKVLFRASIFPPRLKRTVQEGLRAKHLTWDYLFSDNFMPMMCWTYTPIEDMEIYLRSVVFRAKIKPSLQGHVEILIEHYWRVRGIPGQLNYDRRVANAIRRNNLTLPFTISGMYVDEFREYTHAPRDKCGCYSCTRIPFEQDIMGEAWERMRSIASKKCLFMMSWKAKIEFEQKLYDDALWDIDVSRSGEYKQWRYEPDERKDMRYLKKKDMAEVNRRIDSINKQHRLPTHEEMDWIMARVSVTKAEYMLQERARMRAELGDKEKAQATAAAVTATATTCATAHIGSSSSSSSSSSSTSAESTMQGPRMSARGVGISHTGTAVCESDTKGKVKKQEEEEEEVITKMSATELESFQQQQLNEEEEQGSNSDDELLKTGLVASRPKRSSAAKKCNYADAASSSEDDDKENRNGKLYTRKRIQRNSKEDEEEISDSGSKHSCSGSSAGGTSSSEDGSSDLPSSNSSKNGNGDDDDDDDDDDELEGGKRTSVAVKAKRKAPAKRRASIISKSAVATASTARCFRWNEEMDDRLRTAVEQQAQLEGGMSRPGAWTAVADYVGYCVNGCQCLNRWKHHVNPALQSLRSGPWTDAEVTRLHELVAVHTNDPNESRSGVHNSKVTINWAAVAQELNRNYLDCQTKLGAERIKNMKKGPYTAEEDALILRRVREWGDRGQGLWSSLEKEMNRPLVRIRERWVRTLSKRK